MVYRVYVEKKKELAQEAKTLLSDAHAFLGISSLSDVRVINRYDAENISLAAAAEGLILQRIGLPRGTGEQPACRAPHRAGGALPGARLPRRIAL